MKLHVAETVKRLNVRCSLVSFSIKLTAVQASGGVRAAA
jgi:hypothetical protein